MSTETIRDRTAEAIAARLQWSRRRMSTETNLPAIVTGPFAGLQWSRRRMSTETLGLAAERDKAASLQWSRRRMSTETRRGARARALRRRASMEPSTNVDGDRSYERRSHLDHRHASMEPSTNVDGDAVRRDARMWGGRSCFNGAVDECRRRRSNHRPRHRPGARFNGAVDECRRRLCTSAVAGARMPQLQWSRRRMSTETTRRRTFERRCGSLLQWSRRRMSTETPAARLQATQCRRASMEPSTNVDGDDFEKNLSGNMDWWLQWSRRRMSTETQPFRLEVGSSPRASMEPSTNVDGDLGAGDGAGGASRVLQWSRRRMSTETVPTHRPILGGNIASMEPSTNVDGDVVQLSRSATKIELQWSRRRMSTETVTGATSGGGGLALQWSRRRMSTETRTARRTRRAGRCFNGAVDECRRRRGETFGIAGGEWVLQWSRRRMSTETPVMMRRTKYGAQLQWSRRRMSTETARVPRGERDLRAASMEPSTNVDGDLGQKLLCGFVWLGSALRAGCRACRKFDAVARTARDELVLLLQLTASSDDPMPPSTGPLESPLDCGLFGCQGACWTSDHHNGAFGCQVPATDRVDAACSSAVDRAEVEHEDLIFVVIDQGVKRGDHRDSFTIREIAPEHGVLDVVAMPAERGEDPVPTVVIADVISDHVSVPHVHLVANGGYSSISPVRNLASNLIWTSSVRR